VLDRKTLPQAKEAGIFDVPFSLLELRDKPFRAAQRRIAPKFISDCFIAHYADPFVRTVGIFPTYVNTFEIVWADGPLSCVRKKKTINK